MSPVREGLYKSVGKFPKSHRWAETNSEPSSGYSQEVRILMMRPAYFSMHYRIVDWSIVSVCARIE